jgi:hypothetical protein
MRSKNILRYFIFCPIGKLSLEMRENSKNASLAQNATALLKFSYPIQTAAIFRWICEDFTSLTVENYATSTNKTGNVRIT